MDDEAKGRPYEGSLPAQGVKGAAGDGQGSEFCVAATDKTCNKNKTS